MSERSRNLVEYVQTELEQYRAGEVPRLSSNDELIVRFGYKYRSSIYGPLNRTGLIAERRFILDQSVKEKLYPSTELAWLTGILAGGGHVGIDDGEIVFGSLDKDLLNVFKSTGESIFGMNATQGINSIKKGDTVHKRAYISFCNRPIARNFGDLRRDVWPQTLLEKHSWLVSEQRYIWGFLGGFYDARGDSYSYRDDAKHFVLFNTPSVSATNFLSDLLIRVGIRRPTIRKAFAKGEKITGVTISNLEDIRFLSHHLQPKSKEKAGRLEVYKDRESKQGKNTLYSTDEVIEEWIRVAALLHHIPTSEEIGILKAQGQTRISAQVYILRFGNGSYRTARKNLEHLLQEKGISSIRIKSAL